MQNVKRLPKPNSLKLHGKTWTDALLEQIQISSITGKPVPDSYYNKYKKADIRDALNTMYNNRCCYCESKIGAVDFPHIEHLKPKRSKDGIPPKTFPEFTYDWENLHLACARCNNAKGTKYNYEYPIIDPVFDVPIEDHFMYNLGADGTINWTPRTKRGQTTKDHTNLNRYELGQARYAIFREVLNILVQIKTNPDNPANELVLSDLKLRVSKYSSYGSVIKFYTSQFGFNLS